MPSEIDDLRRKLAARKDRPGYAENVREIEARIAELESEKPSENSGNLS